MTKKPALWAAITFAILVLGSCDNSTSPGGGTTPVAEVSIRGGDASVFIGDTVQLYAVITPDNAKNKAVSWISSDSATVTVNDKGLITGIKAGSATITVTTQDGNKTARALITAIPAPVSGVSIAEGAAMRIAQGDTRQLTAVIMPSIAANKTHRWSIDNTAVATVSSAGLVTPAHSGTSDSAMATITVTTEDGNKTAQITVIVDGSSTVSVTGVAITGVPASPLKIGDTASLGVSFTPASPTHTGIVWSSSNPTIVTVDQFGNVSAVVAGTATITAQSLYAAKAAATITVRSGADIGFGLHDETITLTAEEIGIGGGGYLWHVTAPAGYASYMWYYPDIPSGWNTGTQNYENFWFKIGVNTITVVVSDASGAHFSNTLTFRVSYPD